MQRSARFEVAWAEGTDGPENEAGGKLHGGKDYIVLELKTEDMKRLKASIDMTLALAEGAQKEDPDEDGYWTFLFHGRAHPQREDSSDGTCAYPESLLAPEVIAMTPKVERWK
jgi:hypothetical protein